MNRRVKGHQRKNSKQMTPDDPDPKQIGDYRVKKNGAFVNPVAAHRAMPPGDPVPASQMAAFMVARDRALAALTTANVAAASQNQTAQ